LNTSFEFFRAFKENAAGIFVKFDPFDEGFIDAGTPRFSARIRVFVARFPPQVDDRNQVFTTTRAACRNSGSSPLFQLALV
jgi:hypothetical protein